MAVIGYTHTKHAVSDAVEITDGNIGFLVDVSGTLKCKFKGDSAAEELPVIAGVFYPFAITLAMDTGTTDVLNVITVTGKGS